jgi:hypothetical protein
MFIPDGFELYELFPKKFFLKYNNSKLWLFFDLRILLTIQYLRERYGSMIANDWYWKGRNQYRGWRPFDCSIGAAFSQHKFGRAVDLIPAKTTAQKIREDILASPFDKTFKFITIIEADIPWLHISTDIRRDKKKLGIQIIYP